MFVFPGQETAEKYCAILPLGVVELPPWYDVLFVSPNKTQVDLTYFIISNIFTSCYHQSASDKH